MADRLKQLTAEIVSSYFEANAVTTADLPGLIKSISEALSAAGQPEIEQSEPVAKPTAAQIRKSITPDALISFIDGRPYRMLKRHLTTAGLTPAQYRARFGLPADYPVTAAAYSAKRSALARAMGLGRKSAAEPAASPSPTTVPTSAEGATPQATTAPRPDNAGPGARVPKTVRSPKVIKSAE